MRDYFLEQGSDICFLEEACSGKYGQLSYNKRDCSKKSSPRLEKSKWIIALGKHKGIIPGRDWVTVQNILEANKLESRGAQHAQRLFTFVRNVSLKKCGARMFAKLRSNSKGLFDYIRDSKLRGGIANYDCQNLNGQ